VEMSLAGQCPAVIRSVAEKEPAPAHRDLHWLNPKKSPWFKDLDSHITSRTCFFGLLALVKMFQNPVGLEESLFLDATGIDLHSWSRRLARNPVPTSNHAHGARNGEYARRHAGEISATLEVAVNIISSL